MKKALMFLLLLFMAGSVFAQSSVLYCTSNVTMIRNVTLTTITDNGTLNTSQTVTVSETQICPYGCDNSTGGINDCKPDPTQPSLFIIIPALVLFFSSFLLLYIGINIKEGKALQFLFLGLALMFMIANVWYSQNQALATLNTATSNVLSTVYLALIVVMIVVIFYYIITILYEEWKKIQGTKYKSDYKRQE